MTSETALYRRQCCAAYHDVPDRPPSCDELWRSEEGRQQVATALGFRWDDPADTSPTAATTLFPESVRDGFARVPGPRQHVVDLVVAGGQQMSKAGASEWVSGKTLPFLKERTRGAVLSFERFTGLRTGVALAALERSARAAGRDGWEEPRPRRVCASASGPSRHRAALEEDGFTNRGSAAVVSQRELHTVADRRPTCVHLAYLLCALRPGVETFTVTVTQDRRNPLEPVPVRGCRELRRRRIPDRRYSVFAMELRLDRPLAAYEFCEIEVDLVGTGRRDPRRLPMPGVIGALDDPGCRLHERRLRFLGEVPKQVWQVRWNLSNGHVPGAQAEVPASSDDGEFLLRQANPGPAAAGFRWRWPGAMESSARDPWRHR